MIPSSAKCKMVAPLLDLVSKTYLDERIKENISNLKRNHPTLKIGETHCHTTFTDGAYSVADLLRRSTYLGLDFLSITEHWIPPPGIWPLAHALASMAESAKQFRNWEGAVEPVKIYPAFEVSTKQGHLILMFPDDYLKPGNRRDFVTQFSPFDDVMITMEHAAQLGKALGGISIVAHPNITRRYPFGVSTEFVGKHLVGLVDAIEDISTGHGYKKSYSEELGLASIGSTDDHFNFMIGTTVTAYDSAKHADFISAVKARDTQAIKIEDSLNDIITAGHAIL